MQIIKRLEKFVRAFIGISILIIFAGINCMPHVIKHNSSYAPDGESGFYRKYMVPPTTPNPNITSTGIEHCVVSGEKITCKDLKINLKE